MCSEVVSVVDWCFSTFLRGLRRWEGDRRSGIIANRGFALGGINSSIGIASS